MLTAHRRSVQGVLTWQREVLEKVISQQDDMNTNGVSAPEVVDFLAEGFDIKNPNEVREFMEVSIAKLSQVLE